ncbi:aminopeptidase P N-terminal domain-containing protein [Shewanella litorisediminis]|uniref:Xaa-Pro aminopeptidase n=1 Tax=Shewanella litorisediminis TaxID=1173586 RepID=A0ABX7G7N3_9GAMM|nr:aminopeptidase P N-terminal domain-containing protein [Shewanella litorisediminis]MCL2919786.1 aminopeptidase P N-terminal domain-containing protein [Shewanella litorisediminis]QRH03243.1 aminopeptidase P N-terminal domain-containing protein [Shewanella litorisediminis]
MATLTDTTLYAARRSALLDRLPPESLVVLAGYQQKVRSKNIKYHFRQDNDFLYLTGFAEPDAFALIYREASHDCLSLFCRPRDKAAEVSFGHRAGPEGAVAQFGANEAFVIDEFESRLLDALKGKTHVYVSDELNRLPALWQLINHERFHTPFDVPKAYRQLSALGAVLHPMRAIKSDSEIALIRHAVNASIAGHKALMKTVTPGINEGLLAATFMLEIAKHGCVDVGYPNIVASGNNACCLHYEDNCCEVKAGELVLVDAGAEYSHYSADITRTFPVNGLFSNAQRQIHTLVLSALDAAIARVRPGARWNVLYETCMEVMAKGLIELGLLEGSLDEVMKSESYKRFTVHKTGHWLGMDVHDVGPYQDERGDWRTLEPGMVFTLEPGIYIPADAINVPPKYRGLGVRIEDDILVTADGCENLSGACPRSCDEIEAFMASGR